MRTLHHRFVLCTASQKQGGDFAKFCGLLRIYELYIVVRAKPFTIQRGERLVVGVQPKADDRALDGSTFTTLCTHCGRRTYVTYSEKMKRL